MTEQKKDFVFDAELAIKAATAAVVGSTAAWGQKLQEADRKEIIAQAVAKAWMHRDSFDPAKASFQTWVGRIARNCLLDFFRRNKVGENLQPAVEADLAKSPDVLMMEDEGLDDIMAAVNDLPEGYRSIITLLSEGNRPKDIAEILGCTPNAATIRCCRARKALREKLDKQ